MENGYCSKDNIETSMNKGCRHPGDYCQDRQSCIIYFMEREKKKNSDKKTSEDVNEKE